ncbi:hypothetical protein DL96DRAFT_1722969 [Flagelloscypha sp. PMI_526]|nr:hypothetical protein DL96DRAFT_1722969 [Flagelloscypha sp. PMI_526]
MSETKYAQLFPLDRQDTKDVELQSLASVNSAIDPEFSRNHRRSRSSLSLQVFQAQVGRYSWHILCLGLHATFTILYLTQIPIMHRGLEKHVQVAVGPETDRISLIIQILLQALAIAYLSAALFVSQKLFMHRLLNVRQTLTSSHDQYSSWLGLGSAALTLFKQRSATGNLKWLFIIAAYLAASAVVKVCTAALFQMTPETIVQPMPVNATAAASDGLSRFMDGTTNDTLQVAQAISQQLTMVLNYNRFGTLDPSGVIGLEGNTLYDLVPSVDNATENSQVLVNAYTVHANCKMLSVNDFLNFAPLQTKEANPSETGSYWWPFRGLTSMNFRKQQGPAQYVVPISTIYPVIDSDGRSLPKSPLNQTTLVVENNIGLTLVELNGPKSDPNKAIIYTGDIPDQLYSCPQGMAYVNHPFWGDGFTADRDVWSESLGTDGIVGLASCSFTWTAGTEPIDPIKRTLYQPRKLKTNSSWTDATADELSATSSSTWDTFPSYAGGVLGGVAAANTGYFKFWCNSTEPYAESRFSMLGLFSLDM